jgi:predicted nucleic acid-binding Zn ribbon protein
MAKNKNTRKLSTSQIIFYALCAIIILSMVLSAVSNF